MQEVDGLKPSDYLIATALLKNKEMHVQFNDTVKSQNDTVNDTVLDLIKHNNKITAIEISKRLNISLSTTRRRIKDLKEIGSIERIGRDKNRSLENNLEMHLFYTNMTLMQGNDNNLILNEHKTKNNIKFVVINNICKNKN